MPVGTRKPKKKATRPGKTEKPKKPAKATKAEAASEEELSPTISAIIEAGFLAARANGVVEDAELLAIANMIIDFSDDDINVSQIRDVMLKCDKELEDKGFDACVASIATRLTDNESREQALLMAGTVILSDGDYDFENEGHYYADLFEKLGVTRRTATSIWREAFEAYSESELRTLSSKKPAASPPSRGERGPKSDMDPSSGAR